MHLYTLVKAELKKCLYRDKTHLRTNNKKHKNSKTFPKNIWWFHFLSRIHFLYTGNFISSLKFLAIAWKFYNNQSDPEVKSLSSSTLIVLRVEECWDARTQFVVGFAVIHKTNTENKLLIILTCLCRLPFCEEICTLPVGGRVHTSSHNGGIAMAYLLHSIPSDPWVQKAEVRLHHLCQRTAKNFIYYFYKWTDFVAKSLRATND